MNGAQFLSAALIGTDPSGWSVVGTGDFNGDGTTDLLLRDTSGDVGVWFALQAEDLIGGAGLEAASPASSLIQETGDFNGDGKKRYLVV